MKLYGNNRKFTSNIRTYIVKNKRMKKRYPMKKLIKVKIRQTDLGAERTLHITY